MHGNDIDAILAHPYMIGAHLFAAVRHSTILLEMRIVVQVFGNARIHNGSLVVHRELVLGFIALDGVCLSVCVYTRRVNQLALQSTALHELSLTGKLSGFKQRSADWFGSSTWVTPAYVESVSRST